jgi:hypothetical protein
MVLVDLLALVVEIDAELDRGPIAKRKPWPFTAFGNCPHNEDGCPSVASK